MTAYNGGSEFDNANGGILIQSPDWQDVAVANQYKWNLGGPIAIEPIGTSFGNTSTFDSDNIWGANVPSGFRFGKSGNTAAITVTTPVTATGAIELIGGTVTASANLTVNSSTTAGIMLKASQDAIVGAGTNTSTKRTLQTSGGPITLWSNSDASGSGAINMGNFSKLTSGGGAITLAGSANNTETAPSGYARSNGSTYPNGVTLGSSVQTGNVELLSGGGDITLRGQNSGGSPAAMAFGVFGNGSVVNSGTGKISITGIATGTANINAQGVSSYNGWTLRSANTTADAIYVSGDASGVTGGSASLGVNLGGLLEATGTGGGITVYGKAGGVASDCGICLTANVLAKSGPINLIGESNWTQYSLNIANVTLGAKASTNVTSSSANIKLQGTNVSLSGTNTVTTNGTVSILPMDSANSFNAALTVASGFNLGSGVTGFTVGKTSNTASVTLGSAITAAGPISVYGGDVTVNQGLISTLAGAKILLNASGNITTAASLTFRTNNGDLIFWSDRSAANTGAISLGNANILNSANGLTSSGLTGGGRIVLAGGADTNADGVPDGYASSTTLSGVSLGSGANDSTISMYSGGGDVTIRGKSTAGGTSAGLYQYGSWLLNSGKGAIVLDRKSVV